RGGQALAGGRSGKLRGGQAPAGGRSGKLRGGQAPAGGRSGKLRGRGSLGDVLFGLRYIVGRPVLLLSFGIDIVAMVPAMPRALFPQMADERFGGNAAVGWLYASIALGSVVAG